MDYSCVLNSCDERDDAALKSIEYNVAMTFILNTTTTTTTTTTTNNNNNNNNNNALMCTF